jgi:predicted porin
MKLKLTAIALGALCGTQAAIAQSSVTLYGVADVALTKITGSQVRMISSGTQNNGTSRWGLRGSEDLGGGMKASFNLEAQVSLADGSTAASHFSRQANMSLSGGFGTLKAGRALTPSWYGVMAWELTGSANYAVVNSQFGYGGVNSRHNAELSYTSPKLGDFTVTVGHLLAPNNGNLAKNDLNVIYKSGPLAASLVYNKTEGSAKNLALGAAYDFGAVRLAGSWQDARGGGLGKGYTLGATVPVGALSVTFDMARDTTKGDTDSMLEVKYPLSKRTFLYGVVLHNGAGKAAAAVNSTVLGVRHNF